MRAPEFTDQQLVDDLATAAAELGEPLTVSAYDAWQRGRPHASPALLVRRFGSWNAACARAGVATNTTRSTSRRWDDDDLIRFVATFLEQDDGRGSFAAYSAWAKLHDDVPSGATVRQRFPTWNEVKERARELLGE